jgi:hypothetical protein
MILTQYQFDINIKLNINIDPISIYKNAPITSRINANQISRFLLPFRDSTLA